METRKGKRALIALAAELAFVGVLELASVAPFIG
jgi:hypothetical protein